MELEKRGLTIEISGDLLLDVRIWGRILKCIRLSVL